MLKTIEKILIGFDKSLQSIANYWNLEDDWKSPPHTDIYIGQIPIIFIYFTKDKNNTWKAVLVSSTIK